MFANFIVFVEWYFFIKADLKSLDFAVMLIAEIV